MAATVLVDAGFLIALLSRRDHYHTWAVAQSPSHPPPWKTCDAVLSEAFHLLGPRGAPALGALLRREAVVPVFDLADELDRVLTTDADFGIYRRHGRQVVPCVAPR